MRSHWIRMGPNPMTDTLIRKHTERMSHENKGRDWSEESKTQGYQGFPSPNRFLARKLLEVRRFPPLESS